MLDPARVDPSDLGGANYDMLVRQMLGVPAEDRDLFKEWSDRITALVFGAYGQADRPCRRCGTPISRAPRKRRENSRLG